MTLSTSIRHLVINLKYVMSIKSNSRLRCLSYKDLRFSIRVFLALFDCLRIYKLADSQNLIELGL